MYLDPNIPNPRGQINDNFKTLLSSPRERSRKSSIAAGALMLLAGFCSTPVFAEAITNAVPDVARPLPLSAVRLTGGPLKRAQDLDAKYLLELEPDRMMAGFRIRAGLKPKAQGYDGWDSVEGKQLTGHIAGHYLSAVSLMYAATGDERFKERANYLVVEMKEVQDKRGNGYLGAITDNKGTDGELIFEEVGKGNIRSGGFDLNGMWSPWYTLHKTYAGLRDAWRYTGNKTALDVEIRFAGWAAGVLTNLNEVQLQKMLNTEFGGMPEVLADLYADTGDKQWLTLSHKFDHAAVLDPLARGEDKLAGLHGNTQVPKLYGSLVRYACTGDEKDGAAAKFFWEIVAHHHSFATGGHGKDEYFGPADQLANRVDGRTAESCNVYNMLKYTRRLFALQPDVQYAEFQERALFNHVLGSIDPENGRTCYMVPVGHGVQHEYQDMQHSFTCCVGTGMENHALHGDGIYYDSGDKLWVNLYTPSTAEWKEAGLTLAMETSFPEGETAAITFTLKNPKKFVLALRRPSWAGEGFTVAVNGKAQPDPPPPGSYVEIKRQWKNGDKVELVLPKTLRLEPTPDNPRVAALMWGPLVLAGDLGPEDRRRSRDREPAPVPVFVAADLPVANWLKPVADKPGEFRTDGVGHENDVSFQPFYRLHRREYAVYWDLFTPVEWDKKAADYAADKERQKKLQLATVAYVQPGEMQPERDFNYQGPEDSDPERVRGRAGRRGRSWFSFDLPVAAEEPLCLVVTYYSGEQRRPRTFDLQLDGRQIGRQEVKTGNPPGFFDVEYAIPAEAIKDKKKATLRFQAVEGAEIATVFGIRVIRGPAPH